MIEHIQFYPHEVIKRFYKLGMTKTRNGVLYLNGLKLFDKTKNDYAKEYYYCIRGFR
jgi:hypothetical protein